MFEGVGLGYAQFTESCKLWSLMQRRRQSSRLPSKHWKIPGLWPCACTSSTCTHTKQDGKWLLNTNTNTIIFTKNPDCVYVIYSRPVPTSISAHWSLQETEKHIQSAFSKILTTSDTTPNNCTWAGLMHTAHEIFVPLPSLFSVVCLFLLSFL